MSDSHKFCENCGAKLLSDARFCEDCGHRVEVEGAEGAPVAVSAMAGRVPFAAGGDCPQCGSVGESVEQALGRLRGIPEKEKPTDEEMEAFFEREEIIRHLSVPEKPRVFSLRTWILLLVIPGVNVLSIFFSPLKKGLKILVSLVTLAFIGLIVWAATGTFDDPFAPQDTTVMVGACAFTFYLVALLHSWFAAKAEVKNTLWPRFHKSLERWKHLLYCRECGSVFFDDHPEKSAKVDGTADFLAA